jgi:hypothetical protein
MGLLGNGGCLLIKLGVTQLSQLEIDSDKDWGGYGVSNVKELASGMQRGDILQRGDSGVLEKLSPGPIGFEITSNGPGHEVDWQAPPTP